MPLTVAVIMTAMEQYGAAAVLATQLYPKTTPPDSWALAIAHLTASAESQRKGCPRSAYLGLCEAGLVHGIPTGKYLARASRNAEYAIRAANLLRSQPALATDKDKLWRLSCKSPDKKPNGQMDVVLHLWKKGLLR
jgi:hypothetical protein